MREIKFRAWLEGKHDGLSFENSEMVYDIDLSSKGCWFWDADPAYSSIPTVPVMQYTGLKDKNGIEIYNGDVLKGKTFDDINIVVEWQSESACWACKDMYDDEKYILLSEIISLDSYLVVGNIYENPELLKNEVNR